MNWTETELGFEQIKDNFLIFFGKNTATLDKLKTAYPNLIFRTVHQTHSDVCILSLPSSEEINADAHYTNEVNTALVVKTADCLPIMAYDKHQRLILSIHAGWRGVENQITSKSIKKSGLLTANVFIGPAIQQCSFEVDVDVKNLLDKIYLGPRQSKDFGETFMNKGSKFNIDLTTIIRHELSSLKLDITVDSLAFDTQTDSRFHSYRRDKQQSGRNLSFIAQL